MLVVVVAVGMWESPQRFPRAGETVSCPAQRFLLLSSVRRKRNDSVPVKGARKKLLQRFGDDASVI